MLALASSASSCSYLGRELCSRPFLWAPRRSAGAPRDGPSHKQYRALLSTIVNQASRSRGGMCERLKQAVLKTAVPERVPGVRIPLPPPVCLDFGEGTFSGPARTASDGRDHSTVHARALANRLAPLCLPPPTLGLSAGWPQAYCNARVISGSVSRRPKPIAILLDENTAQPRLEEHGQIQRRKRSFADDHGMHEFDGNMLRVGSVGTSAEGEKAAST